MYLRLLVKKIDVQDYFDSFHNWVLSKILLSVVRLFTTHADLYIYPIQSS